MSGKASTGIGVSQVVGVGTGAVRNFIPLGIGNAPGVSDVIDSAGQQVTEAAEKTPWIQDIFSNLGKFFTSIMDWFMSLFDGDKKSSVSSRDNLLARVGLDKQDQTTGVSPFAGVDQWLGIEVSDKIQQECAAQIHTLVGPTGMSTKPADAATLSIEAHKNIQDIIYSALRDKYGKNAEDETRLQTIAEKATLTITNLDSSALTSNDPAHWVEINPPAKGFAGLLFQAQKSTTGEVPALTFDAAPLKQAEADLKALRIEQAVATTPSSTPNTTGPATTPSVSANNKAPVQGATR